MAKKKKKLYLVREEFTGYREYEIEATSDEEAVDRIERASSEERKKHLIEEGEENREFDVEELEEEDEE